MPNTTMLAGTLGLISEQTEQDYEGINERAEYLYEQINLYYPASDSFRNAVDAIIWSLFRSCVKLIFIQQYPSAYVDMHAVLERFSLTTLPKLLSKQDDSRVVLHKLLQRKNLTETAEILEELGAWTKNDVKFTKQLSGIRNGIVHLNTDLLEKRLGRTEGFFGEMKDVYGFSLETTVADLIHAIELILKLTRKRKSKQWWSDNTLKNRRI